MLVTNRATTGSGPMQDLSGRVQAGQTYALTARIKYENPNGPATKQFFATMHYGGATYTNLVSVVATKGQWAQFDGTFTIPAGRTCRRRGCSSRRRGRARHPRTPRCT